MASVTLGTSPPIAHRTIRTVLNIDQSSEAPSESKDATTFHRVEGDPVLRITKSRFSCIRHCCPIDNVFFSAEKEFDLWYDVLKNATKDLWDGENVSLLLHGPAANMRLFAPPEADADVVVDANASVNSCGTMEQTLAPGRASPPAGASSPSHRNDSALEKILRALLREVQHRDVPRHYKAYVAAGACLMTPDGELTNITPQGTDSLVQSPAALVVRSDEGPTTAGGAKGQSAKSKKKAVGTLAREQSAALQPQLATDRAKGRGGGTRSPGTALSASQSEGGSSPRVLDTERSDIITDSSGNRVPMRMFPIPSEEAIEAFAAHITTVCSASMLSADSGASSAPGGERSAERLRGSGGGATDHGEHNGSNDNVESPGDNGPDAKKKTDMPVLLKRKTSQRGAAAAAATAEDASSTPGSPGAQSPEDAEVTSDTFAEEDGDEPRGSMLLLSVQLHQECSISKPRTSYIRILQLIHCPAVIEDALMSIARGRPLPVFASPFSKMIVDRVEGSTQMVFVQSATPSTALAALPSLAIAKATVVRTELASVADDIAAASAAFLATRQRLKDTAREIRDALRGLKHTFAGKEKDLSAASFVQLDMTAAAFLPSRTRDDGEHGVNAAAGKRTSGLLSATKQPVNQQEETGTPPLPQFQSLAAPTETGAAAATVSPARGRISPTSAAAAAVAVTPPCTDDDVLAAEEQVLTFKEQAQVEKLDAEMRIEAVQKELGIHSNRIIALRSHIDEAQRRLITDRYEHGMRKEKLRAELEAAFQSVVAVAAAARTSVASTAHHSVNHGTNNIGERVGVAGDLVSPTVVGVVRAIRGSRKTQSTTTAPSPARHSVASSLSPVGPGAVAGNSLSSAVLLDDLVKQLDLERHNAAKCVTAAQKREREREELLEVCTGHVHALRDYAVALQKVLIAVESEAKASHSYDASLIPSFEDVEYVDRTLVRR